MENLSQRVQNGLDSAERLVHSCGPISAPERKQMSDYLHDKGTDKLIADVMAFDPTKVNPAEADEVPEAFDEFTGPCDMHPYLPPRNTDMSSEMKPATFAGLEPQYLLGIKSGFHIVIRQLVLSGVDLKEVGEIRCRVRKQVLAEYGFDITKGPAGSTL